MERTNRQNIFDPRGTIIRETKYLLHKTCKFGYIQVQDVKVIFKFDLTTV